MLNNEFLRVYPRELSEEQITRDCEPSSALLDFRQYSHGYGLLAHAALSGKSDNISDLLEPLIEYERTHSYEELHEEVMARPDGWRHYNEINFQALNESMHDLWYPLLSGAWPNRDASERAISTAMNSLAILGLINYAVREKFVEINRGTELLYEPKNSEAVGAITGALQEVDVAITVMGIARKLARTNPGITVVPAPMQFENKSYAANADLLFVDMENGRTIGIQTKTSVSNKTKDRYDPDRVVLVDGSIDLGNVRAVRTKKGRSTEAPKPWPGIIAASRVHAIKEQGRQTQVAPFIRKEHLLGMKLMARELVGSLRVDAGTLQGAIEERILSRL